MDRHLQEQGQTSDTAQLSLLLEQERDYCARLRPLLERERTAAVSCDVGSILECVRERELLQADWLRVSERRRQHMRRIGGRLEGLAAADPSLASTIHAVKKEAAAVAREQAINDGVIRSSLTLVGDILGSLEGRIPTSRYDRSALVSAGLPKSFHAGWRA